MINFLQGDDGEKSSRRLLGAILITYSLIGKVILFGKGFSVAMSDQFTMFDKIDGSLDTTLWSGVALVGSTSVDKIKGFFKKK